MRSLNGRANFGRSTTAGLRNEKQKLKKEKKEIRKLVFQICIRQRVDYGKEV